ncbi:MAG TPA: phytanoyl-CoA dioxygenase family protein [Chthonomonadaceae bacterium]|nr:phytanoyl-CoA dioxygenase family protein [Chthonomonadaceae bacterium]
MDSTVAAQLEHLEEKGYVLIPGALSPAEVERCRTAINQARANGWEEGLNHVGNMWFDTLLDRMPEVFGPLVAHPSVRPHLEALLGPQCQLRSLRAHLNPGPYEQEWHMDFYGYWQQADGARYASKGTGINTTFYFQDNGPGIARLTYVKNGHRIQPPAEIVHRGGWSRSEALFNAWCNSLEQETIYPKAGDCVLFFSHIPHQGAKEDPTVERSNVVCHYQNNPFYEGIPHVSAVRPFHGSFPLAGGK